MSSGIVVKMSLCAQSTMQRQNSKYKHSFKFGHWICYFSLHGKWNEFRLRCTTKLRRTFKYCVHWIQYPVYSWLLCTNVPVPRIHCIRFLELRHPVAVRHPAPTKIIRFSSLSNKWKFRIWKYRTIHNTVHHMSTLVTSGNKIVGIQTMCMYHTTERVCVYVCAFETVQRTNTAKERKRSSIKRMNEVEHTRVQTGTWETELLLSKRNCV